MGPYLELLARFLVNMGRPQDGIAFDPGRQRYGAVDPCAGSDRGIHDLGRALVQDAMIIRLNSDPHTFVHKTGPFSSLQLRNDANTGTAAGRGPTETVLAIVFQRTKEEESD